MKVFSRLLVLYLPSLVMGQVELNNFISRAYSAIT